jgi:hypothetical protein
LGSTWAIACLGLASCVPAARSVIRNATGGDVLLWPLSGRPSPLKSGETSKPFVYSAQRDREAFVERNGCFYSYPIPDYHALPKSLKGFSPNVAVVIHEDMTLHVHKMGKGLVEGPEIVAAGLPLKPEAFCGRRGG